MNLTVSREEDLVFKAYCHFLVIKKKCQYNVYERAENIIDDVEECSKMLIEVQNLMKIGGPFS